MALVIDTTFSKAPGSNHTTPTATPTCKRPTPLLGRWGDYAWDNFMDAAQSRPQDPHEAFQQGDGSAQGSPAAAADAQSFAGANAALDSTQPDLRASAKEESTIALRDPGAPPRQSSATDSYASFKSAGSPNNSFAPQAAQAAKPASTSPVPTPGAQGAGASAGMLRQDTDGDSEGGFLCDPTQFVDFAAMGQGGGGGGGTGAGPCPPQPVQNRTAPTAAEPNATGARNSHQPYIHAAPALAKKPSAPAPSGWSPEQPQMYAMYHQPQWTHPSAYQAPVSQSGYPAPAAHYQPGERSRAVGAQQRPISPPPAQPQVAAYGGQQPWMAVEAGGYPPPTAHPFAQVPLAQPGGYPLAPHMVYPPALQQVSQQGASYPGPSDPRLRGAAVPPASHHVPGGASMPPTSALATGATLASQHPQRMFHSASLPLQISRFPPPPPPSMRTVAILAAGGTPEKQIHNVALRWYKRVVASQPAHPRVPPCPEPDFALTPIEAWICTIGEWWKVNYAGMTTSAVFGPPSISPPGSHTKRRGNGGSNTGSANNRSFGAAPGTSSQPNSANNRTGSSSQPGSANNRTGSSSQPGSANNRMGGGSGSNHGSANNRTGSQPNSANNRVKSSQGDSFEVTAA